MVFGSRIESAHHRSVVHPHGCDLRTMFPSAPMSDGDCGLPGRISIHCQGRMQTEMFAPTPSTLSLESKLAISSHDRINHPEDDNVAIAIDVHTAPLHTDIDQDLFSEPPEESELNEDEAWKLHKALYGYRKAPKLWHQHVVTNFLERLNFHSHS